MAGWLDRRGHGKRQTEACGALFYDACDVILDIAAETFPAFVGAAERGDVVEVGLALGQGFEFLAVVELAFVAGSVDHPDLFAFAAVDAGVGAGLRKEPLREAAHGGDAGAGGDKDGVGDRLLEDEVAVRSVDLNGAAGRELGEIGEVIGKEPIGHAIDAKLEMVCVGCGSDGVGTGLLLAVGSGATAEMNWPEMKGKDSSSSRTKSKW